MGTHLSIILALPYPSVLVGLRLRLLLFEGDENDNAPYYLTGMILRMEIYFKM
jgi:hypothetical protein